MNDNESNRRRSEGDSEDIALLDIATVIVRRWKTLLASAVVAVAIAGIALLVLPDRYLARTVVVPSSDNGLGGRSLMLSEQLPVGLSGLIGGGSRSDRKMIEAVLKSRTLADSLVSRMGFVPYSRTKGEAEIRKILRKRIDIATNQDGTFAIEVRDADPERAASIANHVPELANIILSDLVGHAALRKQSFLEYQVTQAHDQLELSEQQLVAFQKAQEAPEIQEQARRTIEAAAQLQQQIIEQEIRVSQLRRTATPDNPELRAAVAELNAWRGQLNRMTSGQGRDSQIFLSLRESPDLRAQATRILRDYTKNEKIYISLTAALTEAQLEARNNLPVVSVLDAAIVPQEPSGRHPLIILAVALVLGVIVGLAAVFLNEYLRGARANPGNEQFFVAWAELKRDVTGIVPRRSRKDRTRIGV